MDDWQWLRRKNFWLKNPLPDNFQGEKQKIDKNKLLKKEKSK